MTCGTSVLGAATPRLQAAAVVARLRSRYPLLVQLIRYALVGGLGTVLTALAFLVLRRWLDAIPANLVALIVSTAVSTEVNRRFTFSGALVHRWRSFLQSLGTVAFYAFYSSAVLMVLQSVAPRASELTEALVVALASVLGGVLRFLVLRFWVFDLRVPRRGSGGPGMGGRGMGGHVAG